MKVGSNPKTENNMNSFNFELFLAIAVLTVNQGISPIYSNSYINIISQFKKKRAIEVWHATAIRVY